MSYVGRLVWLVTGGPEVDVVVVSVGAKGLYALGMFSHEASTIATKERAEMKMIEFFIARKLSLTAPTFNHTAPWAVKRAEIAGDIGLDRWQPGNQKRF
jgi:hypothetical protein